jgi:hypothetical protein
VEAYLRELLTRQPSTPADRTIAKLTQQASPPPADARTEIFVYIDSYPTKKGALWPPWLFIMKMVGRDGFEPT